MSKYEYGYNIKETSEDIREWTINSNYELPEDCIQSLYPEGGMDENISSVDITSEALDWLDDSGKDVGMYVGLYVTCHYQGTDYGDSSGFEINKYTTKRINGVLTDISGYNRHPDFWRKHEK